MYGRAFIRMGIDLFEWECLFINGHTYKSNFLKIDLGKLLETGIVNPKLSI